MELFSFYSRTSGCLPIGWQRNRVWPTGVLHGAEVQIGTRIVCLMYDHVLEENMHSKFVQYSSGVLGDSELGVFIDEQEFNLHGADSKFVECMHIAFKPPILPLDTYYSTVHIVRLHVSLRGKNNPV